MPKFKTLILTALLVSSGASAFTPTPTPTPVYINGVLSHSHEIKVELGDSKYETLENGWAKFQLWMVKDLDTAVQVDLLLINDKKMTVVVEGHGGSVMHFKGGTRRWKDVGLSTLYYQGGPATLYITRWN